MINNAFNKDRALFIPFIMAGHPTLQESLEAIMALTTAGADIIELGVPFSDPVADGPVNQRAAEIARDQGMNLEKIFDLVSAVRTQACQTPILLFSYLNPIDTYGYENFIKRAKEVGVNGVLIVDLPPEEGQVFYSQLKAAGLEFVLLASPTTCSTRFSLYNKLGPSFVYYISRLAVTGMQNALADNLREQVQQLRKHLPNTKIAVGFGISTTQQASEVAKLADGVIVGSLLVKTLEKHGIQALQTLAIELVKYVHM
jgi:tryptophan synthase alpha chain